MGRHVYWHVCGEPIKVWFTTRRVQLQPVKCPRCGAQIWHDAITRGELLRKAPATALEGYDG